MESNVYALRPAPAVAEWFIDGQQSTPGAIAICYRPSGKRSPPMLAAIATDERVAARIVAAGPDSDTGRAADRILAINRAHQIAVNDMCEQIGRLVAKVAGLESELALHRRAAEVWLAGEVLQRAKRAAYKKSRGPQSVRVTFADGIEIVASTYLDGQEGRNAVAQFARASRQFVEGGIETRAQWVRDTKGAWRKIDIRPCPDILTVEYVEE